MISGAHIVVYSKDAEADRAFFRDVLGFRSVDAGRGWVIFALPPAEAAFHPAEENAGHEFYLMCDDLNAEMSSLGKKNVQFTPVEEARWGSITRIQLPGGSDVGLYQPKHPNRFRPEVTALKGFATAVYHSLTRPSDLSYPETLAQSCVCASAGILKLACRAGRSAGQW
ncbi:MAG: VOC family protein [Acidobacteriaceae bacterium]